RVDDTGVAPLAGSFDVVGWFARDPSLLETVGGVLLQGGATSIVPIRAIVAEDAFARLRHRERAAADTAAANLIGRLGLETQHLELALEGLDRWLAAFRHLQALEIWENHAEWVTENDPELGPGVKERFAYAATLTEAHRKEHQPVRDIARNRMDDLLGDGRTILVIPTAPVSPKRDASDAEVEDFRTRTMGLTCPAGLSGFPQISLPLATASAPVGISMVGPRGSDETLLRLAAGLLT
ncbi:MAG: amidase, partial [Rhodospirillaceae bacterium TMED63]